MRHRFLVAMLLLSSAVTAARAQGERLEDQRFVSDRFTLSLDALLASFNTSARVDSETLGAGTEIDAEDDLGFEGDTEEWSLSAQLKFGRRHRLEARYEAFDRNSGTVLERDLQVGDHVFLAGSQAVASTKFELPQLGYRYDFVHREEVEFGITAGVVFARTAFDLAAEVADGSGGTVTASDHVAVSAPVPQVGLGFDWFAGEHFVVRGDVQYFRAALGDFDGSWTDATCRLEWHPWRHAGFALGYRYTRIALDFDDEDQGHSGRLRYNESGLTAGLVFNW